MSQYDIQSPLNYFQPSSEDIPPASYDMCIWFYDIYTHPHDILIRYYSLQTNSNYFQICIYDL